MRKLFSTKRRIVSGVLSVAILAGTAGIAAAFFTSSGNGTGQASVGAPTNWVVTAGPVTGGPLYPGSGSEIVPFTITNNGGGNQAFSTLTATVVSSGGNITQNGTALPGCLSVWFTATAAASSPVAGTSIAGSGGTATDNVTVTMLNPAVNQNVCQNATPDINLAVS
jgi:hypothetical protein